MSPRLQIAVRRLPHGEGLPLPRAQTDGAAGMDLVAALHVVETNPEAHERGYRDVAVAFVRHVARHPDRFPRVDPTRKLLPQLDRLSLDELRELARAVAAEGWSSAATPTVR